MKLIRKLMALFNQAPAETLPIRLLGDLQRLQPQAGDVFVLTVDTHLSEQDVMEVRSHWSKAMGDAQLLVLCPGMSLGCVAAPKEG